MSQPLIHHRNRRFHQNLGGIEPAAPKGVDRFSDLPQALGLVPDSIALGKPAEVFDEEPTVGDQAGSDLLHGAGSHDLLGAARTDAEEELHGATGDPGGGKSLKFDDDRLQAAEPSGFSRHARSTQATTFTSRPRIILIFQ